LKGCLHDLKPKFLETEKTFCKSLDDDKRKLIPQLIYRLTKTNKCIMNEIFDDEFVSHLKEDLKDYQL